MAERNKPSALPKKKRKYLKGLADGKTKFEAAKDAGYSDSTARQACRAIETPDVRAAFREIIRKHAPMEKIGQRIAEGLDAMETKIATFEGEITDSKDLVAWSERRAYAELAAEWGGYFVPRAEIEVIPVSDMTDEQLLARAAQLTGQLKGNGNSGSQPA